MAERRFGGSTPWLAMLLALAACSQGPEGPPRVVATDPPDGASDVDPARASLSVSFDREMSRQGWSWVVEDPATAPAIGQDARFDASGRTNTVSVTLEPGRDYVVWINSERFQHFEDTAGRPVVPYRWSFSTRGEPRPERPQIVELEPAQGAEQLPPGEVTLRIVFDRPMQPGWSWIRDPELPFPEPLGEPRFEPDARTHLLRVKLAPATRYVVWLNGDEHSQFRGLDGATLEPLRWSFATADTP